MAASVRWPARAATFVTIVLLTLLASAAPAAAHGSGGRDATNYRTEVVSSGTSGLSWRIHGGDALVELSNRTGEVVEVRGYEGEPFVRFVPGEGVFENERSPSVYLSRDRYGAVEVPESADRAAPPSWRRVTRSERWSWHDHRVHWMSPELPPLVRAEPSREQVVLEWYLPITVGAGETAREVRASGVLRWVPSVPWWPPVVLTGFASVLVVGFAARRRPTGRRWTALTRPVVVLVWVVVLANVVRAIDDLVTVPATTTERATLVAVAAAASAAALACTRSSWSGRPRGFVALGAAGLIVALVFGGESTSQLSASQLATSLPDWVRRWTVAASYVIVVPTYVAAALGARWYARLPVEGVAGAADQADVAGRR